MFKIRTYSGTLQFATLDAAKTHMYRLYQQGAIRNGDAMTVESPDGRRIGLHLSFGAVMETRVWS